MAECRVASTVVIPFTIADSPSLGSFLEGIPGSTVLTLTKTPCKQPIPASINGLILWITFVVALSMLSHNSMLVVFAILGVVAAGLTIGLVAASKAPLGYQDEQGFHYGPDHAENKKRVPLVVPEPKLV